MLLACIKPGRGTDGSHAFSLVELIGVLAVVAILSAVLVPVALRQLDRAVADQEVATLKSFSDALQQYVVATRTIPDHTTWSSSVASKMGIGTNDVLYNPRQQSHQQSRVFLIDGALRMGWGTNVLPYTQPPYFTNANTAPVLPASPRLMIVSSLGKPLPAAINTNGVLNATYFANLWNVPEGTIPSDAAWSGWNGEAIDVKVQRINLAPLFVHLLLAQYGSTNQSAYYYIDAVDNVTPPVRVVALDGYFLQGSVLSLYNNQYPTNFDSKLILAKDTSLVFEDGVWRDSILGARSSGTMNVADIVQQFLNAAPNTNAYNWSITNQTLPQVTIVNDLISYMSNYNAWAAGNFTDASKKNALRNFQQNVMMPDILDLYSDNNGKTTDGKKHLPSNPFPCF